MATRQRGVIRQGVVRLMQSALFQCLELEQTLEYIHKTAAPPFLTEPAPPLRPSKRAAAQRAAEINQRAAENDQRMAEEIQKG